MMIRMKSRLKSRMITAVLTGCTFLGPVLGTTRVIRAASDDDLKNDARLEGPYQGHKVVLDGGNATTYILLFALGIVGLSVLFKDAKRSHLD